LSAATATTTRTTTRPTPPAAAAAGDVPRSTNHGDTPTPPAADAPCGVGVGVGVGRGRWFEPDAATPTDSAFFFREGGSPRPDRKQLPREELFPAASLRGVGVLETLACLFAAVVLDLGHLGLTYHFLVAMASPGRSSAATNTRTSRTTWPRPFRCSRPPATTSPQASAQGESARFKELVVALVMGTDMADDKALLAELGAANDRQASACAGEASPKEGGSKEGSPKEDSEPGGGSGAGCAVRDSAGEAANVVGGLGRSAR